MILYDYFLRFESKEAAQASLPDWFDADGELFAPITYAGAMPVSFISSDGDALNGYGIMVTLPEQNDAIFNAGACLVEIERPSEEKSIDECIIRSKPQWRTFTYPEPQYSGVLYVWEILV